MFLANSEQIRQADDITIKKRGYPGIFLMETAGTKTAHSILETFPEYTRFLILAGPGNNGGDGLVIARIFAHEGMEVAIIYTNDQSQYSGDALLNYQAVQAIPSIRHLQWTSPECAKICDELDDKTLIVDALLGTGINSSLRGSIASAIEFFRMRQEAYSLGPVVAVDLPSGLSADTGEAINVPLEATATYTFQLPKLCHFVTPAAEYCGEVVVVDIGIEKEVIESLGIRREILTVEKVREELYVRGKSEHKGSVGHALIIGGSVNMCGAVALSASAALKAGIGLCTVLTPGSCKAAVFSEGLEAMVLGHGNSSMKFLDAEAVDLLRSSIGKFDVIAVGPGLGSEKEVEDFLLALFEVLPEVPIVWDADALNILAEHPELLARIPKGSILTPHPGEMKRLMPDKNVFDRRIEASESFAKLHQCSVVLKGANTIIAFPDGSSFVNTTGNPGMATAGSGDVLTGILAARIAISGMETGTAEGVFIHGLAGDLAAREKGMEGLTAGAIADKVGMAFANLDEMEDYPHRI